MRFAEAGGLAGLPAMRLLDEHVDAIAEALAMSVEDLAAPSWGPEATEGIRIRRAKFSHPSGRSRHCGDFGPHEASDTGPGPQSFRVLAPEDLDLIRQQLLVLVQGPVGIPRSHVVLATADRGRSAVGLAGVVHVESVVSNA